MSRLFWKILFSFWLSLLLIIGALSLPNWLKQQNTQRIEAQLIAQPSSIVSIKAAANTLIYGGKSALLNLLKEQHAEAPKSMQIYVLDQNNHELLGRAVDQATLQAVRAYQAEELSFPILRQVTEGTENYLLFAPWSGQFPAFNQKYHFNFSKKHQDDLLILLGILAASFCASVFLTWYLVRPIQILEQGFQHLASGDLAHRVSAAIGQRRDQLADLGQAFDQMATQLQALMTQQTKLVDAQKHLLNDVSHELRSPLTRLNMSIALAQQQPERIHSSLERIEQEAERLNKLVGEILTLSKLEAGLTNPELEYIDLIAMLEMLVEAARFEANARQQSIELANTLELEELLIRANGDLLYRALENVVRNAIQHTAEHTQTHIGLSLEHHHLKITVSDNGTGLPEQELASIFDSFYCSSQSTQEQGYGLGLAIAKRAILFHGGSIRAQNRPTGGLQMIISLPYSADSTSITTG